MIHHVLSTARVGDEDHGVEERGVLEHLDLVLERESDAGELDGRVLVRVIIAVVVIVVITFHSDGWHRAGLGSRSAGPTLWGSWGGSLVGVRRVLATA